MTQNSSVSNSENQAIVLAVDDNPRNLQLISSLLNQNGYKVVVASSGENALKYLSIKRPDLILLDVMMPGMSGYEVCEKVKQTPSLADIPIIFLSAKSDLNDIVKGFKLGAADYISKPFKGEEVLARLRTHIELSRSRAALERKSAELSRLSQELEQKNKIITNDAEQLRKTLAEKDRFFSILAHDLRAPLAGFLITTELLENNFRHFSAEETSLFITTMSDSARQLNKLLENLLSWAQLQLGTMTPKPENIYLSNLSDSVVKNHQNLASQKNLTIINQIPNNLQVYADYQMTHTILRNLLSNAIKFTPRGGNITIQAQEEQNEMVSVAIADSGIGMSEETLERLFRLDTMVSRPGTEGEKSTGLGLILCMDLALRNNGTLKANSILGKGSTFVLGLPKAS